MILWVLAFATSALLVIRFGTWGTIAGIVTIWGTGWIIADTAFAAGDFGPDSGGMPVVLWLVAGGWITGAAWTMPILLARAFVMRRRRLRADCSGQMT